MPRINVSRVKSVLGGCPMRYYYTHHSPILGGKGFVKRGDPKEAADFGTAAHEVFREYAKTGRLDFAIAYGQGWLEEKAAAYEAVGLKSEAERLRHGVGGGTFPCKACNGTGKTPAKGLPHKPCAGTGAIHREGVEGTAYLDKMIRAYMEQVDAKDSWGEVLLVEKDLEIDLGTGYTLIGRPDKVVRWNGRLWHNQHRTLHASATFENEEAKYDLDWHEIAYQEMITRHFGEQCAGSFVDLMRKTREPSFHRVTVPFQPHLRDRFFQQELPEACAEDSHLSGLTPGEAEAIVIRSTTSCTHWNRVCPYIKCCTQKSLAQEPDSLVELGFVPRVEDYVDTGGSDEGRDA